MTVLGVDLGTTALKAVAFDGDGLALAQARVEVAPKRTVAGEEVQEPDAIWTAFAKAVGAVCRHDALRADPVEALAISASGDEVFPVDRAGRPLMGCILSGDDRGGKEEAIVAGWADAATWFGRCGHQPSRMDPALRWLWLRHHAPEVAARTHRLLGWHEYLALRLVGEAATDPSLAGKWAVFDRRLGRWSPEALGAFDLAPDQVPRLAPWGETLGRIGPAAAEATGLPVGARLCTGGYDATCAALGSGALAPGIASLACGTWEVLICPLDEGAPPERFGEAGVSLVPYPGGSGTSAVVQSADGASVLAWAGALTGHALDAVDAALADRDAGPGPLLACARLHRTQPAPGGGRRGGGMLAGLSPATTPQDVFAALMEAIAIDLADGVDRLRRAGADVDRLRATGGGTRSAWWMQLKTDLCDTPVALIDQDEPGAFGAALLALSALGNGAPTELAHALVRERRGFVPSAGRRARYAERIAEYRALCAGSGP